MTDAERLVYAAAFAASVNSALRGTIVSHDRTSARAAEDAAYAVTFLRRIEKHAGTHLSVVDAAILVEFLKDK